MTYPHQFTLESPECEGCGVPRVHADPPGDCPAAMHRHVAELKRHAGSTTKARAEGIAHERAVVLAYLRQDAREHGGFHRVTAAADAIERGEHHAPAAPGKDT